MRRLSFLALAGCALLSACAAPPATTSSSTPRTAFAPPPDGGPGYGPGDTCADTYVILTSSERTNFSLGSENFRNSDFCAAYPYLRWLTRNAPLFTGEDPDDRNFLRLAGVYEYFATRVDSTNEAERRAYLDSALTTRRAGREAMDARSIPYDSYLRDLREGFFYFQNAAVYEDADAQQFAAFNRAFEAKPDSLEDWYLGQLFIGSSAVYEDPVQRAAYVDRLAAATDDPGQRQYFTSFAEYMRTPQDAGVPGVADDTAVRNLVAALRGGNIADNDALSLLAVSQQQPERLEALGEDPDALIAQLVRLPAVTRNIDNPRTLLALAFGEFRGGNSAQGNQFFDRAIANAGSNGQRSDFYYARAARGYGNRSQLISECLRLNPSNGSCIYARAGFIADAVGRPSGVRGRAAYWCLADIYRNVAATTSGAIAANSRRAAAGYERAGPTREQYFLELGWQPGQTVTASLGSFGSCSTRVR